MSEEQAFQSLGASGEEAALGFLSQQGYTIVKKNFRAAGGEIDVIARDGEVLCFIEVKTRSHEEMGSPFEAVSKTKQRKIAQVATAYLAQIGTDDLDCRFDVLGIEITQDGGAEFELLKDAFEAL